MTPKYCLDDLPIPHDAVAGGIGWNRMMIELADHIGPYKTLLLCDYFGGRELYIPRDGAKSPFIPVIGLRSAAILAHVFGTERITVPLGKVALARSRMGPLVTAARTGRCTIAEAAQIAGTRRDTFSRIANDPAEFVGIEPAEFPIIKNTDMLMDAAALAVVALKDAGGDAAAIETLRQAIVQLGAIDAVRLAAADSSEALALLADAQEAREHADAIGGSLIEAYRLMSLAAAAGSTEASSHLLDMGEEMSPWQRSIARGSARWTIGLRRVAGEGIPHPQLPLTEALALSRAHLGLLSSDDPHPENH